MGETRPAVSKRVMTIPNVLSLLRLVLVPFFIGASLQSLYTTAFVIFVSAAVTDAVDGYIARRLNQRSTLGAILDPAADKTMMFSAYVVYTFVRGGHHVLPAWLTLTIFARDFLIVFFAYLLYTRVQVRRFPPSVAGKISTLLQVVSVSATIAANTPLDFIALPILWPLYKVTLAMTLYSGFDYMRRADRMLVVGVEA